MEKKSYYAIIPAKVRYCKKLELGARLLYGEITALCNQEGFCWASNKYFADSYDTKIRTIQRWVNSLKESNFIKVEVNGLKRKIYIMDELSYEGCDADGNLLPVKKTKIPKTRKDLVAKGLQVEFQSMAKKFLKIDVVVDKIGYFSVLRVMNQHKMTPEQIKKLFLDWFMTQGPDRVTSITACLSNRNVEKYKLQHGIISK